MTFTFNQYTSSFTNYLRQKNNLFNDRIHGKEISQDGRLSLINLVSAFNELKNIETEYQEYFFEYPSAVDSKEEYSDMIKLCTMWDYIHHYPFRTEKSFAYNRKEDVKKYRQRIQDFYERQLNRLDGVLSVTKEDRIISIIVNAEMIDQFYFELFNQVKATFPEAQPLSLHGILFKEYFTEIRIHLELSEEILPGGLLINSNNLVIYNELEKFLRFRTPLSDSSALVIPTTAKSAAVACFALTQTLLMVFKHSTQINEKLIVLCEEYIVVEIQEKLFAGLEKVLFECVDEIKKDLSFIFDNVNSDRTITKPILDAILENFETLKHSTRDILSGNNFDELKALIETIDSIISTFLDQFATRDFH